MIEEVRRQVSELLDKDTSGHNIEHVNRVLNLSLRFAETENVNRNIVALVALLHDVDDWKLFGMENAKNLTNARKILAKCNIQNDISEKVLANIRTLGYNKRLSGIIPTTLEGMVVSDADMCDGAGATGILRTYQYQLAHGSCFFDKNIYPDLNLTAADYLDIKRPETAVTHIFEKLLKLKGLMLTGSGKKEMLKRHEIMVDFMSHFLEEENEPEWIRYLNDYLAS